MTPEDEKYLKDILRCLRVWDAPKALALVDTLVARAERAEMALRDLEALTEEVTHIEDFSLTTMIEIIRAYKEASCLKPSHG